jgi:hypothetical protein
MRGVFPACVLVTCLLAACVEEPVHRSAPAAQRRTSDERRSRPFTTPGTIGMVEGTRYFVDLQADRPDALVKRPVLVEVDEKKREVGHAYLNGAPDKGIVDVDVVVLASRDTVTCYDAYRHEVRWEASYADRGLEIDELVRRGSKLDVYFAGRLNETLSLATGQKTVP